VCEDFRLLEIDDGNERAEHMGREGIDARAERPSHGGDCGEQLESAHRERRLPVVSAEGVRAAGDYLLVNFMNQEFECLRCGRMDSMKLPMPVSKFLKLSRAFKKKHAGCRGAEVFKLGPG
jgi:hypothetical protein